MSTRAFPPTATDAADPQSQKAPSAHKAHRTHVVGGAHRTHGRNPSFGKNLNKLQRLHSAQNVPGLGDGTPAIGTGIRHHQRKKSAPVTPAGSFRGSTAGSHVRWEASHSDHKTNSVSMRKNNSTPALARNPSGVLAKKALVTDRPHTAKGRPKKSVGFELGDSDSEEQWEDSTQSPESTRRGSVVPSTRGSAENSQVLVDPLTFVKRPYPQILQSRSLPESSISKIPADAGEDSDHDNSDDEAHSPPSDDQHQSMRIQEHEDIATRLLSQSRSSKAPPAMSSISAMATPTPVDTARRNASLTNLASSHDTSRHGPSAPSSSLPHPTPQATSSSIEGGVSRFIINNRNGAHPTSRTDSDPHTPSSFLPHYHPQTPPSPGRTSSKKTKTTSPQPRPPGDGPPSRTQQKLWLQRTAALTTSPPDPHLSPAIPPASIDPVFMAATHSRPGSRTYDNGRGAANGSVRAGATHDNEAKHIRKAYEKTSSELNVVRRFQNPTKNSFGRLSQHLNKVGRITGVTGRASALAGKSVKSAPSLTNSHLLQSAANKRDRVVASRGNDMNTTAAPAQLIGKNRSSGPNKHARVYFQEQDDVVNINEHSSEPVDRPDIDQQRAAHPILSTSLDDGDNDDDDDGEENNGDGYFATEQEMLLRRMWESRGEIASPG
jgi:hypothetical protein